MITLGGNNMNAKNIKICEELIGKEFGREVLTTEQYKKAARLSKKLKRMITEIETDTASSSSKIISAIKKLFYRKTVKELTQLGRLVEREMVIFEETHIDEPNLALILLSA